MNTVTEVGGHSWARRYDTEDQTTYMRRDDGCEMALCDSVVAMVLLDTGLFTDAEATLFTRHLQDNIAKNVLRALLG